ncbi:hypothetical protein AGJ34_20330 [Cronobacter dublinensis subsp. dublinensis]|nr:hypothetical protein [Cronobacter dublinensis subsp. dublinensis]EGT5729933.1 hypothetical protein [Cronobacter dublinensis subsp. dublinensis]
MWIAGFTISPLSTFRYGNELIVQKIFEGRKKDYFCAVPAPTKQCQKFNFFIFIVFHRYTKTINAGDSWQAVSMRFCIKPLTLIRMVIAHY